ncbi:MAG: hypothetical protein AB8C46_13280 [Burkholderiaceae bacterium]
MSTPAVLLPASAIEFYIRAKDQHQPALITEAFDPAAVVTIEARTDTISFPPVLSGRELIEQVLVKDFAVAWQDVRTFCFCHPGCEQRPAFTCQWMVAMHSRSGEGGRLGYGTYDWSFAAESGKVRALSIRIDEMLVVPERQAPALVKWAGGLSYPWITLDEIGANPAPDEAMAVLVTRLREND